MRRRDGRRAGGSGRRLGGSKEQDAELAAIIGIGTKADA